MPLPEKPKLNEVIVYLREFGWSYGDIQKVVRIDKRNISKKYKIHNSKIKPQLVILIRNYLYQNGE